ncbi:hypothetical protein SVAN01_11833 [Stagonosporopsis vannaccii]|nr:hypothetical protein SVAN01_11833 [Stagonosporopsis vannaccii]
MNETSALPSSVCPKTGSGQRQPPLGPNISLEAARQHLPQRAQPSLPRRKSKYLLRRSPSQSRSISISAKNPQCDLRSLPLQRWRNSPPEDEAASLSAIHGALQSSPKVVPSPTGHSHGLDSLRSLQGPSSRASVDSGASGSSLHSSASGGSAVSTTSQHLRVTKTRKKSAWKTKNKNAPDRMFKCTFCCDTFKHKYDWSRHEKSVHLNLEEWHCTSNGAFIIRPNTGRVHCAYCDELDPSSEHLDLHNHDACRRNPNVQRVFRRKDHLVQHLRLVHKLETMPPMEDWKAETMAVVSRCGFCDSVLETWDKRIDHLTIHFRAGKTMLDWQGDHGFDPAVAAHVTNALPPYLIGSESLAPVPFSATNPASIDHFKQISSQIDHFTSTRVAPADTGQEQDLGTTQDHPLALVTDGRAESTTQELDTVAFADILTRHLGQFARQQMAAGIMPTDDMFQRECRRVLYDDEHDAWNTTIADNADWLKHFRSKHGCSRDSGG